MNPKIKHSRDRAFKRFVYIFFFLMCACFVLPLIVVISASFTSEQALTSGGFSLLPRDFTLDAYKSAFSSGTRVLRAYGVTIFQAVVGTVLSSLVAALAAYPLSRSNFRFRKPITIFIFFTMLFGAGMIPNYIIFAKYYKLADSIWIYILPGITGGAWNTMVFRTFFKGLPETLFEAAYLDGASELRIFFSVVLPLSTPVFASLGFMALVARWNDYTTSMIYIRNESLYIRRVILRCLVCRPWFGKAFCDFPELLVQLILDRYLQVSENRYHPAEYAAIPAPAHDGSGGIHEESCEQPHDVRQRFAGHEYAAERIAEIRHVRHRGGPDAGRVPVLPEVFCAGSDDRRSQGLREQPVL